MGDIMCRSVRIGAVVVLLVCAGQSQAAITFVDATARDYRISFVSDLRLDGIEYTATFTHNISGGEWLLGNPGSPTIVGHQEAMRVAGAINEAIAAAGIEAQEATKVTRNAYLPYSADQPFPASVFSSLASQSPLQYEIGASSLLVRNIGKYPEWAMVSLTPQLTYDVRGDYNDDGVVDAADYTVWRDHDGTLAGYVEWRENFGKSHEDLIVPGTAAVSSGPNPVPEPTGILLACLASMAVLVQCHVHTRPSGQL